MKKIAGFISRLDHYIWKKTRKDSYISTLLLRVSLRFHKTSSFNRIIFIFFVSALFFAIMVLIRIAICRA